MKISIYEKWRISWDFLEASSTKKEKKNNTRQTPSKEKQPWLPTSTTVPRCQAGCTTG
jgi:hypothetical protein